MPKPTFAVLLCRMRNGTVAKLRTHRIDGDDYKMLSLSPRQLVIMATADRVTAPDINGNASQQTRRRS